MRKIGLFVLAIVLALGALGVGYAAWTDEVTITGDVNTGTVDLVVEDYSCTYVWKVGEEARDADDMVITDNCTGAAPEFAIDAFPNDGEQDIDPVAFATSAAGAVDDSVVVNISNAFPLLADELKADFLLHYVGSVPVRVEIAELEVTGDVDPSDVFIEAWESNEFGDEVEPIGGVEDLLCYQLHQSNRIKINVIVEADQEEQLNDSGKSGTITGRILVKQWNEVDCPAIPVNPECEAATCSTFITCNAGGNCGTDGVCGSIYEGGGTCVMGSAACADLSECPGGSSECGTGEVCLVSTCCGSNVCYPDSGSLYDFCFPAGDGGASVPAAPAGAAGPSIGQ